MNRVTLFSLPLVTLLIPHQAASQSGRLTKGIRDLQQIIVSNQGHASNLQQEVTEHLGKVGEIIYTSYGQEGDPGRLVLELKAKIEQAQKIVQTGRAGQYPEMFGEIAQGWLDIWSKYSPTIVNNVNVVQQLGFEFAQIKSTLSDWDAYQGEIARDTQTLRQLQEKSRAAQTKNDSRHVDPPVTPPDIPPFVASPPPDLSALDDAIMLNRWLDVGNRAFANKEEENAFYKRFPTLAQYRTIAEYRSPASEVQLGSSKRASRSSAPAVRPASPSGRNSHECIDANTACQLACPKATGGYESLKQAGNCVSQCYQAWVACTGSK